LALDASGITDRLVETSEQINRLNADAAVVFSDAPLEERVIPSVRLGIWATGTAATLVGIGQAAKALATGALEGAATAEANIAKVEPDFVVTEEGVAIPKNPDTLKSALSNLSDKSTNPAASRKFVGADANGPIRIRIEKAHSADPNFVGESDPLHAVDHLHIDRKTNVTTGKWYSQDKVQYDWPY
jgi:hypothetical protein